LDRANEDIDIEYLQHFWDLSSKDMVVVIDKAKQSNRPKFYINLLSDMLKRKKNEERKEAR